MEINEALKIIGSKYPILKESTIKAETNQNDLIYVLEYLLKQYNETLSIRNRMHILLGDDLIKCIKGKAEEINYFAEIKLMELQSLEGFFNMN